MPPGKCKNGKKILAEKRKRLRDFHPTWSGFRGYCLDSIVSTIPFVQEKIVGGFLCP
jgi:hypothetical protein